MASELDKVWAEALEVQREGVGGCMDVQRLVGSLLPAQTQTPGETTYSNSETTYSHTETTCSNSETTYSNSETIHFDSETAAERSHG